MVAITETVINPETGTISRRYKDGSYREDATCNGGLGYRQIWNNGKVQYVHRMIWEHVHGPILNNMQIDHINGNRKDNRIANLRIVSNRQNQENRSHKSRNTISGVKGVHWHKQRQKWVAKIQFQETRMHLGLFSTIEEAKAAYDTAALVVHTHNQPFNEESHQYEK